MRAANIVRAYARAGFDVRVLTVYEPEYYVSVANEATDVPFRTHSRFRLHNGKTVPLVNDLQSGIYARDDAEAYARILVRLPLRADVFHLEQPWLLPLCERLKTEPAFTSTRVVYGSQNIEAPLKRSILKQYGIPEADEVALHVSALEGRACKSADISVGVSASDCAELVRLGATTVLLAPNGTEAWQANESSLAAMRTRLPRTPFALFVASAHPPNMAGFMFCFGESLAFLPPDHRIVVVGGVCEHFLDRNAMPRNRSINLSRLTLLRVLDEAELSAVKTLAHAFILPITFGGGSNIKTAEALFSGKAVVGTTWAFRGFEPYVALPGVRRVDGVNEFRNGVLGALRAPVGSSAPEEAAVRAGLLWSRVLAPMAEAVFRLVRPAAKSTRTRRTGDQRR